MLLLSDFDYELPEERIAQVPVDFLILIMNCRKNGLHRFRWSRAIPRV